MPPACSSAACSATASSTRLQPGPRYLTTFYLMISLGGALGALLVGIAAPLLLNGYFELGITLVLLALLLLARLPGAALVHRRSVARRRGRPSGYA